MQAGQTLYGDNGKQVLLWPMPIMLITQVSGPDSYSHCCGHPVDCVGTYARYPIYAPCDCHLVYSDTSGNTRGYTSDDVVNYATGVGYVSFSFTHDEIPPSKTSFKQGELIAHTGQAGFALGDHCHLDQSKQANAQLIPFGITCWGGNPCYALAGSVQPYEMWFINDTVISNAQGMPFKTYEGGTPGPGPEPGKRKGMPLWMYLRKPF